MTKWNRMNFGLKKKANSGIAHHHLWFRSNLSKGEIAYKMQPGNPTTVSYRRTVLDDPIDLG